MAAHGGYGKIYLFTDFAGAETPIAGTGAYAAATGNQIVQGPFKVVGDLAETDTGLVALAKSSGYARISGNDEDGKGVAVCTETIFSPALNGPLIFETRVEGQALTTRSWFCGFCDTAADDIAEPLTSVTVTHTLTASNLCGFVLDSQLTAAAVWHACYNGGTTTGATASTTTTTGVTAVAGESDILRIVIEPNGTARWYINGVLESTVVGAVSTTVLQAALVGCWGTTTTAADIDCDYIAVEANRDWTR